MTLLPVPARSSASKVEQDHDARVLYVRIDPGKSRRVTRTLACGGINFDIDESGIVLGVEVLLNSPDHLAHKPLAISPHDDQYYDLQMSIEPDVSNTQIYDSSRQLLQVGGLTTPSSVIRLNNALLISTLGNEIAVWISGVAIDVPNSTTPRSIPTMR